MTAQDSVQIGDYHFSVYLDEKTLHTRVNELGAQLAQDYSGKTPYFLSILNGAFIFGADLVRAYANPCEIGFVRLSSYKGTSSTGKLTETLAANHGMKGKDVIIVEDIIDSGLTMSQFLQTIAKQEPNSVKVVSLFVKPEALQHHVPIDYIGFEIPNAFIVGYGLDLDGIGRNLRQIYKTE